MDDIYFNEKGIYLFCLHSDPKEASKADNFRKNVAAILKAVRIKLNYPETDIQNFVEILCDATEDEVNQKLEELL